MTGWRCGTYAGYEDHRRRGEPTCQPCRTANTERMTAYRRKHGRSDGDAAYHRARNKALLQLAKNHREEFKRLLLDAKMQERLS